MNKDWIFLTFSGPEDDARVTCKMPHDEQEIEVKLDDGSVVSARFYYGAPDEWDFVPADDEDGDSLLPRIIAWRCVEEKHENTA